MKTIMTMAAFVALVLMMACERPCSELDGDEVICKGEMNLQPSGDTQQPPPPRDECHTDDDCSGNKPYCNDGQCSENCTTAQQCDNGDKVPDTCVDGRCLIGNDDCKSGRNVLGECVCDPQDDGNKCTIDTCEPWSAEQSHTPKDCADTDASTLDTCDPQTGECMHESCMDDDPCTVDMGVAGGCEHTALCAEHDVCVSGLCLPACDDDSDCDDANPCTIDSCDEDAFLCHHIQRTCDDGDARTLDYCVMEDPDTHRCDHLSCEPQNDCQVAMWDEDECLFVGLPCGEGTVCEDGECVPEVIILCENKTDCDDANPCTQDECVVRSGRSMCQSLVLECDSGSVCNLATGACVVIEGPDCPSGCDDSDPRTLDYCDAGTCRHHQPVTCGEGTMLNPQTGECTPAQAAGEGCEDGQLACIQFELGRHLVYAVCVANIWFQVESCGPIQGSACILGQGCVSSSTN